MGGRASAHRVQITHYRDPWVWILVWYWAYAWMVGVSEHGFRLLGRSG